MTIPADPKAWRIGLIGYGEVGRVLAEDLRNHGIGNVAACDLKLGSAADAPLRAHAERIGVGLTAKHGDLAAGSDLLISAVTASQTVNAAQACARSIARGAWYLDFNSASPGAKKRSAALIDGAGGQYVEGAVMTAILPHRIGVPLLLGGRGASALAQLLNRLGFDAKAVSAELGVASATKMCRSVLIKGMEATVIEAFTAARAYGVEDAVLASLAETFPGIDWEKLGGYFFQRVIQHGRRRAEEMREAAHTLAEVGLAPRSASATAATQAWIGELADQQVFGDRTARRGDWRIEADRVLGTLNADGK